MSAFTSKNYTVGGQAPGGIQGDMFYDGVTFYIHNGSGFVAPQLSAVTLTGNTTIADAGNVILGSTTGTQFGTAASQKLSFYGATPIIQRSGAAQAAVATTGSTQTTPFGYSTSAQADAIVTLVNEIRAALVAAGLIKGAA